MSLETDLLKLKKLIKKYQRRNFDLDDHSAFVGLIESIRAQFDFMKKDADKRSDILADLGAAIIKMKNYAEKNQMPQDKYNKDLFRFTILELDGYKNAIMLLSASKRGDKLRSRGLSLGLLRSLWIPVR